MTFYAVFPISAGGAAPDTTPPVIPAGQVFTVNGATATNGTQIGTVAATDNVGVTFLDITAGNTNGAFTLLDDGRLFINSATAVQAQTQFVLTVVARDAANNQTTGSVTVNVTSPAPVVNFRSLTSPASQTPAVTPSFAALKHPSGNGTIYAGGAGETFTVTNVTQWNNAVANAGPGDIVDITQPITVTLDWKGNKWGFAGTAPSGAAGNPIIIGCSGAGKIQISTVANTDACLELFNVDHVWLVGLITEGSRFGVFCRSVGGTSTHPTRIAHCNISGTGFSGLGVQGNDPAGTALPSPPAGAGNTWGFSEHVLIEGNSIYNTGLGSTSSGECMFLGWGISPGWESYARNITIRYNDLYQYTAGGIDVNPGCSLVNIIGNRIRSGASHFGAMIQLLYVASGFTDRPAWYGDPQVKIEHNRFYDHNLTVSQANSSPFAIQCSLAGVTIANNIFWAMRDSATTGNGIAFRLRSERAASNSRVGTERFVFFNNLCWTGVGLQNSGAPLSGATPFNTTWVDARNNIGATGTTGVQFNATSADFKDPPSIPPLASLSPNAAWLTYGPGSAFDLATGSTLNGTGAAIADLVPLLHLSQDISQRAIPGSGVNPGPFQDA